MPLAKNRPSVAGRSVITRDDKGLVCDLKPPRLRGQIGTIFLLFLPNQSLYPLEDYVKMESVSNDKPAYDHPLFCSKNYEVLQAYVHIRRIDHTRRLSGKHLSNLGTGRRRL